MAAGEAQSWESLPASRGGLSRLPRNRAFAQTGHRGLQQLNEQSSLPAVRQRQSQGSGQHLNVGNHPSAGQPMTPQGYPHSPKTPSSRGVGRRQGSSAVRNIVRTPQHRGASQERESGSNLPGPLSTQVHPPKQARDQTSEPRRRGATVIAPSCMLYSSDSWFNRAKYLVLRAWRERTLQAWVGFSPRRIKTISSCTMLGCVTTGATSYSGVCQGGDFYVGVVDGHGLAGKNVLRQPEMHQC